MEDKVRAQIETAVKNARVLLFMKGTRNAPQCGFSATVVSILNELGPTYETVNVYADPAIRDGIKEYSQWPTLPQLYVNGEFVGGCDIVKAMHASGELATLLGIDEKAPAAPRVTLTPSAAQAFKDAATEAPGMVLRLEASERFEYELYFADAAPGDLTVESEGLSVHVNPASARRLDGTRIDFLTDEGGAGFKITNPNEPPRVKPLSPKALKAMLDGGASLELFDVRTAGERAIAAIAGSRLLDQPGQDYLLGLDPNTTLVFQCHHGIRSRAAAEHFLKEGFKNIYNLEGGIDAWSQQIDPTVPRY